MCQKQIILGHHLKHSAAKKKNRKSISRYYSDVMGRASAKHAQHTEVYQKRRSVTTPKQMINVVDRSRHSLLVTAGVHTAHEDHLQSFDASNNQSIG